MGRPAGDSYFGSRPSWLLSDLLQLRPNQPVEGPVGRAAADSQFAIRPAGLSSRRHWVPPGTDAGCESPVGLLRAIRNSEFAPLCLLPDLLPLHPDRPLWGPAAGLGIRRAGRACCGRFAIRHSVFARLGYFLTFSISGVISPPDGRLRNRGFE